MPFAPCGTQGGAAGPRGPCPASPAGRVRTAVNASKVTTLIETPLEMNVSGNLQVFRGYTPDFTEPRGFSLLGRAQFSKQFDRTSPRRRGLARTPGPAPAVRHVHRRSPLPIGDIELRSIFCERLYHGIHGEGSKVNGGLSSVIDGVDIDMLIEQKFHGLEHLGLGGVFVREGAQPSPKA